MGLIDRGGLVAKGARVLAAAALSAALAACSQIQIAPAPHLRPLPTDTMMLLGKKGMNSDAPLFVRIFKEESELEVWKQRDDGRFYHFKTYPICHWSGMLGPKTKEGDKQAPEGFYQVASHQMNPNSQFHLGFNLGYPNAYDRAHRRTGESLMVHGKCKSAGCYAMTDALIEEIYGLAREAFAGGQDSFQVHAFPFRMTEENLARHKDNPNYAFWQTLKEGYDHFETTRLPPAVAVCERRYFVNVKWNGTIDPAERCPAFQRPRIEQFVAKAGDQAAEHRVVVSGPKLRAPGDGQGAGAAFGFAGSTLGRALGFSATGSSGSAATVGADSSGAAK